MKNTPEDIIILHKCVSWQPHDVWFLRYRVLWTECFVILDHLFALPPLPNSPKNENNKKMKKTIGDIINLLKCTKNHDHRLYCSSDMVHDRCNWCHFGLFLPFYPRNSPENEYFKKIKHLVISSFYTSVPKLMIICCTVPEIWHVTDVIIFHFGLFFNLLPANSPNKKKLTKMTNYWRYHHFTLVYQKSLLNVMLFLRYGVWWM